MTDTSRSVPIDNSYNNNKSLQARGNNDTSLSSTNNLLGFNQPFPIQTFPLTQHQYSDHYEYTTPIPSTFNKDNLRVSIDHNMLTLSADLKVEKRDDKGNMSYTERHVSSSVSLPVDADPNQVNAKYDKGKLLVDVPRIAGKTSYGRNVDIQSA